MPTTTVDAEEFFIVNDWRIVRAMSNRIEYKGYFVSGEHKWAGDVAVIYKEDEVKIMLFVWYPPEGLKYHPLGRKFRNQTNGKFAMLWYGDDAPKSGEEAVVRIQTLFGQLMEEAAKD